MTRIDDKDPINQDAIERTYGKHPLCGQCKEPATIWIMLGTTEKPKSASNSADLFLCDIHAFHLARVLMQDIGHIKKIVRPLPGEPR